MNALLLCFYTISPFSAAFCRKRRDMTAPAICRRFCASLAPNCLAFFGQERSAEKGEIV